MKRRRILRCLQLSALLLPAVGWAQTAGSNSPFSQLDNGQIRLGIPNFGLKGGCSLWSPEGHGNWNIFQSCQTYNPTELQVYSNAAQGIVDVTQGTNQVTLKNGTAFSQLWAGLPYFYYEGNLYRVEQVADSSHLTVRGVNGAPVKWESSASGTYYFVTTSVTATCDVDGRSVTRTSGQPFIPFYDLFYINGSPHAIASFDSPTKLTLAGSAGNLTGATCVQYKNINNELSILRLQGLSGKNEENFAITETPGGTHIQSTYAGSGKYRPIFIEDGENPAGTQQVFLSIRPNPVLGQPGVLGLGGDTARGNQVVEVAPNPGNVNYWLIRGAAAGAAPSLAANGPAPDISVNLSPKGNGVIHGTGPIQLQEYTVAALPKCTEAIANSMASVSDQRVGPQYRGSLTGGGHLHVPVYCGYNGEAYAWEAH